MPRKLKVIEEVESTEIDEKEKSKLQKKRTKKPVTKKKMRGDKLDTIELSGDGFTTDEEEDDKEEQYEHCQHLLVQETAVHHSDQTHSPRKKHKISDLKTVEVKVELKDQSKTEVQKRGTKEDSELSKQKNVVKKEKLTEKNTEVKKVKKPGRKKATPPKKFSGNVEDERNKESNVEVKEEPAPHIKTETYADDQKVEVKSESKDSKTSKRGRQSKVTSKEDGMSEQEKNENNKRRKRQVKSETKLSETQEKSKKVKSEKNIDACSEGCHKFVGAHVSIVGGLYKSVLEAVDMKAKAFGMFLKSQRQWACKPLEDNAAVKFRETCQEYGFLPEYILPHGSYLMNCGSPDGDILQKSRDALIDELQRCEKLGLTLFNFHPGSTCGKISVEKCLDTIAESINYAHSKTNGVITVIENMSCQGHTVGGHFEELRGIIDRVKDKSRIGVCLDTCHAFAAGFDLSTEDGFKQMMSDFEQIVGFQYLKALHLNDSKGKVGCKLDRHENIGKGHIGKDGFRRIMNHPKLNNIPMILETPCPSDDTYAKEVKMLYAMCKT